MKVSKEGRELGLVLFVSTANRLHSGLVISMCLSWISGWNGGAGGVFFFFLWCVSFLFWCVCVCALF